MSREMARSVKLLATLPLNILLNAILIIPFAIMIYLAFLKWSPAMGIDWWEAAFVGVANFVRALGDARFVNALTNTVIYTVSTVSIEFLLGLLLAYLMLGEFTGKKAVLSLIIYPLMLPPVIVASVFYLMFQPYGPVNNVFLRAVLGDDALRITWFLNPRLAFTALIIADIWQWTPFIFLILYSALSAVPRRLVEAAQVLGASSFTIFWRIRLPLIKPLIIVAVVLRALEAFKMFDYAYLMTGGGPGVSTETISLYIYRVSVLYTDISYAAAMSLVVLVMLALVIRLFIWYFFERVR
ncbi:MAG: sugar ABC transporter permease [Ignisphaera sp.]|nr:sugar ABC transporter permease [Ignisphaera sp.]MDW8084761.1 sugar ABC transporter permease [Ignisphaera sp.]